MKLNVVGYTHRHWRTIFLALTFFYAALFGSTAVSGRRIAHASTAWIVTRTDDVAGGSCTTASCTLRDALSNAQSGDTITFAVKGNMITIGNGTLKINSSVTITGPGASKLAISSAYTSTIFAVSSGVTASISGLTIQDGYDLNSNGGGIYNSGNLTVDSSTLSNNTGKIGGGVFNGYGATLIITNSTLSNNAANIGAGIYSDNTSFLTVSNSTLFGNKINVNTSDGGGIYNYGTATISNSTITNNWAGTYSGKGGGLYNNGTISLLSSIVYGNKSGTGDPDSYKGTSLTPVTSYGHNILGTVVGLTNSATGDQFGVDPNLGLLQDNGGPTYTISITKTSFAYGAGDCSGNNSLNPSAPAVTTDQRGVGYSRKTKCDVGAFEFEVAAAPAATHFSVTGFQSQITGGSESSVTVTALDASNTPTTNYSGTVAITSSDPAAILPANAALTNGVGTFKVTLKTSGPQSIIATDTQSSGISGRQTGILVTDPPAVAFSVTGFPATIVAGTAGNVTVTALDSYGNKTTNYGGTVKITSSDPFATLPYNAALTNGVGTFSVTLNTAGPQSIMAQDSSLPMSGVQLGIIVTSRPTTHFSVTGFTSPISAGTASTVTVTALDDSNKVTPNYSGTVAISSSDPAAVLPTNAKLTNGVGVFSVTLNTVGTQSITATDTSAGGINGAQNGITVTNLPATHFSVTGFTSPVNIGTVGSVTVTALDATNKVTNNYSGTVAITSSDTTAILPANAKLTNGVAVFKVTLDTVGTQSITATDTITSGINGAQTGIVVTNMPTTQFSVTGFTSPIGKGTASSVTVTALDAANKVTANYSGTVAITSSDAAALLPASAKLNSGVGVFNVTLNTIGIQSIIATDTVTNGISGEQSGIVVAAAVTPAATVAVTATVTVPPTTAPVAAAPAAAAVAPTAPISSQADPVSDLLFDPALALPGEPVTLIIVVNNKGTGIAQNVIVTDPLPGQLDLISVSTTQGTYMISDQAASVMPVVYTRGAYLATGQVVIVHLGDLQPGQQAKVTIQARVNASVTPPLTIINSATITGVGLTTRTATQTLRVTAGVLPGTGEVPDNSTFSWLELLLLTIIVVIRSNVKRFTR